MERAAIIAIRPFRPEDNDEVQKLIHSATMSTVNQFFLHSLFREIFFQLIIGSSAVMFIFLGLPLYSTLFSIPLVSLIFYIAIYIAHYYKATYLHSDIKNIPESYSASNKTIFYVAEAYGSLPPKSSDSSNELAFITETEIDRLESTGSLKTRNKEIVGTIGVMRDRESAVVAWIRRMSVKKQWRRLGIGSHLIDAAVRFCNSKSFVSVDLITTECHKSARRLYEKKGFEAKQLFHKKYLTLSSASITMSLMSLKTRPNYRGTAAEL